MDAKKRFSQEQVIGFLREAEAGMDVKDLWRSKFGGISVPDAKRLKDLEAGSNRLKKLLTCEPAAVLPLAQRYFFVLSAAGRAATPARFSCRPGERSRRDVRSLARARRSRGRASRQSSGLTTPRLPLFRTWV